MEQVLLEGGRDSRLARGGQAREPDGKAALGAQLVALVPRERRVPGDIAALVFSNDLETSMSFSSRLRRSGRFPREEVKTRDNNCGKGTHVAIVPVKFPAKSFSFR